MEMRSKRGVALESGFDQRIYFRFFLNLQTDLAAAYDSENAGEETTLAMRKIFADLYRRVLTPLRIPCFAFAWLELATHNNFMPRFLRSASHKQWGFMMELLVDALEFMRPSLEAAVLTTALRSMYKGFLRVMLVLLHDFPEFLCAFHASFCDAIAPTCVQLRNLILSAFPRSMRLPDPFTPDLKVDLLPEISLPPRVLSNYGNSLARSGLKAELDRYLRTGNASILSVLRLPDRLVLPNQKEGSSALARFNAPLINSIVLYVGVHAISQLQQQNKASAVPAEAQSAPMELFLHLATSLEDAGRYLFINAIANQLRFPNNHTHYFSCVILFLFSQARDEMIQEQVTRVLLERLIVHRPHPWGLLITFIELIKNPRYSFWKHEFTRCSPEIKKLFESVARTCMPGATGGGAPSPAAPGGVIA
jgi:CCR4-NOT transcription complex subunit 1